MNANQPQNKPGLAKALSGKTGLYVEKMSLSYISISDVQIFDTGFQATATTLRAHGLHDSGGTWTFGAGWDHFDCNGDCYSANYLGWDIYLDPALAEKLFAILCDLPPGSTYRDDYTPRPFTGTGKFAGRFIAIHRPGPIASKVHEFLSNLYRYKYSLPDIDGSNAPSEP